MTVRMGRRRGLLAMLRDRRGAVTPIMALWLIPLIGLMGLGVETAGWFYTQRAAQNAADSAVMAASTNACVATDTCHTVGLSPTYDQEAKAVTAKFGFDDAAADVVVTTTNTDPCPSSGLPKCFRVTITKTMPVNLLKVLGFASTQNVVASSWASPAGGARTYCVLALGTSGTTISNNSPSVPPAFCHMMTNSASNPATNCTKQVADIVDAVGTVDTKCVATATNAHSGIAAVSDANYSSKAALIPADPCGGTYNDPGLNTATITWGAAAHWCGSLKVLQNVVVTTPASGTVLTIYNGDLNLHPSGPVTTNLTTAAGSGLTIVFTGHKAGASHTVVFGNPSVLDVAAPTSGSWSGIALYQDPSANGPGATNVDQSMAPATGGGAAWKITGLMYLPNAAVSLSGGVIKSTAGQACFSLVAKSFSAGGNYSIYSDSQTNCAGAGLTPPTSSVGGTRQSLVK